MKNGIFLYLMLLILSGEFLVAKTISKTNAKNKQLNLNLLPANLVEVEKQGESFVLKEGKCCQKPSRLKFSKDLNNGTMTSEMGFEAVSYKILHSEKSSAEIKIIAKQVDCHNCKEISFSIFTITDKPHLFRTIGSPFGRDGSVGYWVDENHQSNIKKEIINDCPKDGEAC